MRPIDVHLELLKRLPVRVVESKRKPPPLGVFYSDRKPGGLRDRGAKLRLVSRVQEMRDAGVERFDIAEALNLSTQTVDRFVCMDISQLRRTAAKRR